MTNDYGALQVKQYMFPQELQSGKDISIDMVRRSKDILSCVDPETVPPASYENKRCCLVWTLFCSDHETVTPAFSCKCKRCCLVWTLKLCLQLCCVQSCWFLVLAIVHQLK